MNILMKLQEEKKTQPAKIEQVKCHPESFYLRECNSINDQKIEIEVISANCKKKPAAEKDHPILFRPPPLQPPKSSLEQSLPPNADLISPNNHDFTVSETSLHPRGRNIPIDNKFFLSLSNQSGVGHEVENYFPPDLGLQKEEDANFWKQLDEINLMQIDYKRQ